MVSFCVVLSSTLSAQSPIGVVQNSIITIIIIIIVGKKYVFYYIANLLFIKR